MKNITAAKAVMRDGNKYLTLTRSMKSKHFAGAYDFPGGKVDPGETPKQALIREVFEETGLEIRPKELLGTYGVDYNNNHYVFGIFECSFDKTNEIKLDRDNDSISWLTREEILSKEGMPFIEPFFSDF